MADKRTIEKLDKRIEELIAQRDRMRAALERIATEKERVPVKHKTGVSGEPRFVHEIRSRVIAENALTDRFSFDLSELPEDAVITGATLLLDVSGESDDEAAIEEMLDRREERIEELEKAMIALFVDPLASHGARALIRKQLGITHVPHMAPWQELENWDDVRVAKLLGQL